MGGEATGISSLEYWVKRASGRLVEHDRVAVEAGALGVSVSLPPGEGYRVELEVATANGGECRGTRDFDVRPGARVEVDVGLDCRLPEGQADVTGTLHDCPTVAIAKNHKNLAVGESLTLATEGDAERGWVASWSASGGELSTEDDSVHFTCTEKGKVKLSLSVDSGRCVGEETVEVHCVAAGADSEHGDGVCHSIASGCHPVHASSDAAHACHELGHAGDEAACSSQHDHCGQVCGAPLCDAVIAACHEVDPGTGPLHECHELAHAGDASVCFARGQECLDLCTAAGDAAEGSAVAIHFEARAGNEPLACGAQAGSSGAEGPTLTDLRMFVHDVRLITAGGAEVAVELDERGSVQTSGVALLDFEDASGQCLSGDAATNRVVTGNAAPGDYTGVAFRLGVPEALNHLDPAGQPAPLAAGNLHWSWLSGYRFLRAESGGDVLHLGSGGCSGDPRAGAVSCARSNRVDVRLDGFNAATDRVVVDLAELFAGSETEGARVCHSSGAACEAMFSALGLSLATGDSDGAQRVFRRHAGSSGHTDSAGSHDHGAAGCPSAGHDAGVAGHTEHSPAQDAGVAAEPGPAEHSH